MAAEKASAIVIRTVEFSESSLVVTLFTEEFGKVSALAKGARRPKGPFESALDLLSQCRIVFLRKTSGALDLLTEAKLERRFRPANHDLSNLYAGYYVAELLFELTDDHDPQPELYAAARDALERLASSDRPVASTVLCFEMAALRVLGHLPSLEVCAECGTPIVTTTRVAFGGISGGVLCPRCRPGKTHVTNVAAETIQVLRRYAAPGGDCLHEEPDPRVRGEVRGLVNHYLSHLLGHKPRMHAYLGSLSS